MQPLFKTLPAILEAGKSSPEVMEAAVIAAWKHAVGEALANHAAVRAVNAKTVTVAVADDVWQQQLESMRRQLVFRLNAVLGQPLIKRLEVRVEANFFGPQSEAPRKLPAEPTADDLSLEVWSAASSIHDARLRKVFLRAAAATLRRRERQRSGDE